MAAIAVTLERQQRIPPLMLLIYALLVTVLIALFLTIRSVGSTTVGTPPTPRPETGPPVTAAAHVSQPSQR
jgi:hypothetical protein